MEHLKQDNDRIKEELIVAYERIKSLQESVGSWRRKAENRHPRINGVIRQGFDQWRRVHYKVYVVNVPQDLDIKEALKEIHIFLQTLKPYRFARMDFSKKYDGYLIQVEHLKNWDLDEGTFED